MVTERGVTSRFIFIATAWILTFLCCALAMAYFYGLLSGGLFDPFKNYTEEGLAVLRTAFPATLLSSLAIWIGIKGNHGLRGIFLRTGIATQISLTLYAIAGWQPISDHLGAVNLIFPGTFFAEYNWLTFILEVAPVTSLSASLLLCLYFWRKLRNEGRVTVPAVVHDDLDNTFPPP
jgi:hypothetical protein